MSGAYVKVKPLLAALSLGGRDESACTWDVSHSCVYLSHLANVGPQPERPSDPFKSPGEEKGRDSPAFWSPVVLLSRISHVPAI